MMLMRISFGLLQNQCRMAINELAAIQVHVENAIKMAIATYRANS